jgi:hypothetical protein
MNYSVYLIIVTVLSQLLFIIKMLKVLIKNLFIYKKIINKNFKTKINSLLTAGTITKEQDTSILNQLLQLLKYKKKIYYR